ncbi:MAG TPA: sigma-70 family RNA polymerase sigma factor, partial [Chitinophagaceae bacterium]|nr:sigma-70 family RNA polymerase sigma factor [Chitinophagaceae bacterium]
FRHESGKMIAVLSGLLGLQQLQAAEDIVQDTLLQALQTWTFNGMPDNPTGWLHRVARNKAIDYLRRNKNFQHHISPEYSYLLQSEEVLTPSDNLFFEDEDIEDSQLRMIFACCHPAIPLESQLALALKTLCGLSTSEIARAFLTPEETIAKRIYRAKEKIRTEKIVLQMPHSGQLTTRLDAVLHCLYLLFNEGYNSAHPSQLIREELCEEAIRLSFLLTKSPATNKSVTNAVLALFCLQASRLRARLDEGGNIILLKHQDRSLWFTPLIDKGLYFLNNAATEDTSVYHLEAAIAYFHAIAPSFDQTDWQSIYRLYTILYAEQPTPFIALNKAIAALYAKDAATALDELTTIKGLSTYYLYYTALGEVYLEMGKKSEAHSYYRKALSLTNSLPEQQLLLAKMQACEEV